MIQKVYTYKKICELLRVKPQWLNDFCQLYKVGKRYFAIWQDKDNSLLNCVYVNTMTDLKPMDLYLLLSGRLIPTVDANDLISSDDFTFKEKTDRNTVIDFACSLFVLNDENFLKASDETRFFLALLKQQKEFNNDDSFLDEDYRLKLVLRDKDSKFIDIWNEEVSFENYFGYWNWQFFKENDSNPCPCFSLNPLLLNDWINYEVTNWLSIHYYVTSRFDCPEFIALYRKYKHYVKRTFLLSRLNEYVQFLDFLCLQLSDRHCLRLFEYTDKLCFSLKPFDTPIGTNGMQISTWLDEIVEYFEGKGLDTNVRTENGCFYLVLPKKIEIIHAFATFCIEVYGECITIYNPDYQFNTVLEGTYLFDR